MPKRDYIEFQDRSTASAYLITFRTYGTWLPGNEDGSVDRRHQNRYGTPKITPSDEKVRRRTGLLKHKPVLLGAAERSIVENAIREVCRVRGYVLTAVNVRTNHVHVVVSAAGTPERVMDSFKAYATKALRAAGMATLDGSVWSRHGSTRYLWAEEHVVAAVEYVDNGQGGELPGFE